MSEHKKVMYLVLSLAGIMLLPFIGSWLHFDGKLPTNFFEYPMLGAAEKAPYNNTIFWCIAVAFLATALLYIFPRLFGFKKPVIVLEAPIKKAKFPVWFYTGSVMFVGTLALLFTRADGPLWLLHWSDLPIFWGFTLLIDGVVYRRKGGSSIFASAPRELVGIAVASIFGWMIFEYLNFFVEDNWYYPRGFIVPQNEFLLYAIIGSSGLMPMAFEWYSLLRTFPKMKNRWDFGPKFSLPNWLQNVILIAAFAGMFGSGLYPQGLFFSLWVSPLVILSILLSKFGVWTPFAEIKKGNWTPVLLFALTYLIQGVTMEGWNYLSAYHGQNGIFTYAPAYWMYSIPYVYVYKVFEMPLLGYLGYLPFGVYCWVWWIFFAYLLDIPTKLAKLEAPGN